MEARLLLAVMLLWLPQKQTVGWDGMTDTEAKGLLHFQSLLRPSFLWPSDLPQKLTNASVNIHQHLASTSHGTDSVS